MVTPVQPGGQMPVIPVDAFAGQKMERGQEEMPRLVVEKKDNVTSAREEVPREEVEQAAEKLNRLMGLVERRLKFEIHDKSNRVMVKIIDEKSGEVLREVPPKKILDMLSSFAEYVGLLVDKKV
ncbi:MAG: flagellar biosynthesis protein FlaG [Gracilibacter sp. BRH_c7a]|nr:MAG: flagellar biosynthesis protein FlaG [Gracilibacter sp. BRH_c7a]